VSSPTDFINLCKSNALLLGYHSSWAHESIRHLGFDELREITLDKWDEEVWGAAHASPTNVPRPKLFFYFAEEDPWVAGHTRDYLMKIRGREKGADDWKPRMEIDQLKIPHAFCLGEY
jgi:Lipid-droplet associated hydrolase